MLSHPASYVPGVPLIQRSSRCLKPSPLTLTYLSSEGIRGCEGEERDSQSVCHTVNWLFPHATDLKAQITQVWWGMYFWMWGNRGDLALSSELSHFSDWIFQTSIRHSKIPLCVCEGGRDTMVGGTHTGGEVTIWKRSITNAPHAHHLSLLFFFFRPTNKLTCCLWLMCLSSAWVTSFGPVFSTILSVQETCWKDAFIVLVISEILTPINGNSCQQHELSCKPWMCSEMLNLDGGLKPLVCRKY